MNVQTKIKLMDLAEYLDGFLDSQYYVYELRSVSDVVFVNGFTVATMTYTLGAETVYTRRWSFRREDWDDRIIAYFHDESVQ